LPSLDPAALGLRLALAGLLLRPVGVGALRTAVACLALVGLVVPAALRWPALWLALAALCGWRVIADWPLSDNHAYLLAYVGLAVGVAPLARRPEAALAWNARMLIGLAFPLAVGWKLAAPDSSTAASSRDLSDPRLEPTARLAAGVDTTRSRRARVPDRAAAQGTAPVPAEPPRLQALARDGRPSGRFRARVAVALAFLWLAGRSPSRLRDALCSASARPRMRSRPSPFGWLLLSLGRAGAERGALAVLGLSRGVRKLVLVYRASLGEAFAGI
jgi:hypothetical protein